MNQGIKFKNSGCSDPEHPYDPGFLFCIDINCKE